MSKPSDDQDLNALIATLQEEGNTQDGDLISAAIPDFEVSPHLEALRQVRESDDSVEDNPVEALQGVVLQPDDVVDIYAEEPNPIRSTNHKVTMRLEDPEIEALVGEAGKTTAKKKKRGFSLRRNFKAFLDPKNWPEDVDEVAQEQLWPKRIYMGYLTNLKKKDMIGYIDEWVVDNNCNRSSVSYQIIAWRGGFAFEVHEGGTGRGALQSVLANLTPQSELTVPSSDRSIRVTERFDGFSTYMLNEFESNEPSPEIAFKDSMSPLYKRNHGLMLAGALSAILGLSVLMVSQVVVHKIIGAHRVPVFEKPAVVIETPWQQVRKVTDIAARQDAYLKNLSFSQGRWKINLENVSAPASTPAPVDPNAPVQAPQPGQPVPQAQPAAPQASASIDLKNLHTDLINTLAEERP